MSTMTSLSMKCQQQRHGVLRKHGQNHRRLMTFCGGYDEEAQKEGESLVEVDSTVVHASATSGVQFTAAAVVV